MSTVRKQINLFHKILSWTPKENRYLPIFNKISSWIKNKTLSKGPLTFAENNVSGTSQVEWYSKTDIRIRRGREDGKKKKERELQSWIHQNLKSSGRHLQLGHKLVSGSSSTSPKWGKEEVVHLAVETFRKDLKKTSLDTDFNIFKANN